MGQQQLLLIVLGVIIVGIAIVVGLNVFTTSSLNANNDAIISDLTNLTAMAQQYYKKPASMGGGGNTFTGWTIPGSYSQNANGWYQATVGAQSVTLIGRGKNVNNAGDTLQVEMVIGPSSITSTTTNVNN